MLPLKIICFITFHILINQMDTLSSIQVNNCYQLSRDVRRIKENNTGIKAILAALNETCWKIISSACIVKIGDKFWYYVRVRKHPNSIEGDKKYSSCYSSKLAAEIELHSFRLSLERAKTRPFMQERIRHFTTNHYPIQEVVIEEENQIQNLI